MMPLLLGDLPDLICQRHRLAEVLQPYLSLQVVVIHHLPFLGDLLPQPVDLFL